MQKISIREDGLVGTLFRVGNPACGVILLGGSSGGMNEALAERFAKQGFAVLALAYFAAESLPSSLHKIPLEYFETAIHRLQKEPGIKRIGLWGGSRGGELSLILGTLFPELIQAIAVYVPSSVVYGSLQDPDAVAWLYQGKSIAPNAPFGLNDIETRKKTFHSGTEKDSAIALTPFFLNGMKNQEAFQASAIPVEKLRCPLLLISAEDDQMWPSALYAQQIIERLDRHQSTIDYSHLTYPGVGHAPSKGSSGLHPILKRWFAYGGNPKDNAYAAEDWIKQTDLFFKRVFTN